MNRLQTKCLLGSLALHLSLLTILVVGPGFLKSKTVPGDDPPWLEIIPWPLVDGPFSGGGSPNPAPSPPAPAQQPAPAPAPPPPAPRERQKQLESPAPKPPPTPRDDSWSVSKKGKSDPKDAKGKHQIVPDLTPGNRNPTATPSKSARSPGVEGGRGTTEARQAALAGVMSELRGSFAGATEFGVGGGGPAYASYGQALKTIYTDAWNPPDDVTDDTLNVRAEIVVARNGRVTSFKIAPGGKSGVASLDRSVQEVLERVRNLPPFPEESKDTERTFKLVFNLKLKRSIG